MKSVFHRTILDNGIRVVTEKISPFRSISIGLWVNVGSRDEEPKESGLSHFIEHMAFKGTKKRTAKQIAQSLESLGGHLNAFTSREQTCYYARVLDEHLPVAVDVLADLVKNSLLTPTDLKKEKKVILEEIKDVTVIAATNRPDMLDAALLRAGRFDRVILVDIPDAASRKKIFEVHTRKVPLANEVNINEIVKMTEGFVGADIESFIREAAMTAMRKDMNSKIVKKEDFDEAFGKIKPSVSNETSKRYRKLEEYYLKSAKAGMEVGPIYAG